MLATLDRLNVKLCETTSSNVGDVKAIIMM